MHKKDLKSLEKAGKTNGIFRFEIGSIVPKPCEEEAEDFNPLYKMNLQKTLILYIRSI
jgi:hypothetical protein